jgi:3',5'-cyclic AMP phosphodiesterase CpdA
MVKSISDAAVESNAVAMRLGRRAWLRGSSLLLIASGVQLAHADSLTVRTRVGLVTDMHFADKPAAGTRHYRETLGKLEEARKRFADSSIDTMVELGDFIDAAESVDVELMYLHEIQKSFHTLCDDRHHVLGNHCVDTLTKVEFLRAVGQEKSFYSFDRNETHFVVLDACFRSDGTAYGRKNFQWTDANISQEQVRWLKDDLAKTEHPTIVLVHQRLDRSGNHEIKNSAEVRSCLEASGKVRLVLQGHSHKNDLQDINGIHYCTLAAMVEGSGVDNNGYSILEILEDGAYRLEGFRQQKSYTW